MNNFNKYAFLIALCFAVACSSEKKQDENVTSEIPVTASDTALPAAPAVVVQASDSSAGGQTIQMQPVTPPAGAKAAAAMNPAHGEPGHRCDIPVGAPLNSPATQPASQQMQVQPSSQQPSTVSTPAFNSPSHPIQMQPAQPAAGGTPTAAGMNPPHGEPGHDCAIPVGSPLKK